MSKSETNAMTSTKKPDLTPAAPITSAAEALRKRFGGCAYGSAGTLARDLYNHALSLARRLDAALAAHKEECASHDESLKDAESALAEARREKPATSDLEALMADGEGVSIDPPSRNSRNEFAITRFKGAGFVTFFAPTLAEAIQKARKA